MTCNQFGCGGWQHVCPPVGWDRVRVVMDVDVLGGIQFRSPPMESHQADILLIELSRGPFTVLRARVVPAEEK